MPNPVFPLPIPPIPGLPINNAPGGIRFKDAAITLCNICHNGIAPDDPRVMERLNQATQIIMNKMIPVGGMATYQVTAFSGLLALPPQLENAIEAFPADPNTLVRGDSDITQGWYNVVNNSTYLDPSQHHDNPLVDLGLWPDSTDPSLLRRLYSYPGLQPDNAVVWVTGKKRFIPVKTNDDYLIVQNLEALRNIILSIERAENADPDDAPKYRQLGFELLEAEVKNFLLDPSNYMRRKSNYYDDTVNFPENSMGWLRGNLALDIDEALKMGKMDLIWTINQIERRIMHHGIYKDMVTTITAQVVGGALYFPIYVGGVLAIDLNGCPIPIRSQFFQHMENGPGMFPCTPMLVDQGDQVFPGTQSMRRKYKLIADCTESQSISAVCLIRWISKKPHDLMTIKNYEAIRLMFTAKNFEEKQQWQEADRNQQQAFSVMDEELARYLNGIKHTVHVENYGFGMGDVGDYWTL